MNDLSCVNEEILSTDLTPLKRYLSNFYKAIPRLLKPFAEPVSKW